MSRETVGSESRAGDLTVTGDVSFDGGTHLTTALASKLDLAGGKILQVVRATDSTSRSTTSTSFVDVTGMSVTITPQKSDSAIIILYTSFLQLARGTEGRCRGAIQITDSSDNAVSGAEALSFEADPATNYRSSFVLVGYSTPATTSATTYKARFLAATDVTIFLSHNLSTGQMFAIEVSA